MGMLKPQDVCVLLKIVAIGPSPWSYGQLAYELGMSASEVHAGVRRTVDAGLMRIDEGWGVPEPAALDELLVHGVRYVWAAERGPLTPGMPTAQAAAPLAGLIEPDDEPPPVWPDPEGDIKGMAFMPLYKSVPTAARRDPQLYLLLALVDAIRGGPEPVREAAVTALREQLGTGHPTLSANARRRALRAHQKEDDGQERRRLHR